MEYKISLSRDKKIAVVLGTIFFLVLRFLFPINTDYDYYTRLSQAFISGHVCLQENYPWLNELVPIAEKGFCVVYPITPALVFVPFVYLFSTFTQTSGAHLFFGLAGSIVYLLFRKKKWSVSHAILMSIAWCFGTIFLSLSAVGSAWYIAQTIGSVFALLALFFFDHAKKKNIFFAGLFLGLAATARLPLHLYGFYFALLFWQHFGKQWKKLVTVLVIFGCGFLPLFTIQRIYNYVRYNTFSDAGYYLIPGKFEEEDFKNGEFNLLNIPKHLKVLLGGLPKRTSEYPYIVPSYYGLSILITSPFIVIAVIGLIRQKRRAELIAILSILLLEMSHGTVGFTQFGYRFALDAYPLLFLGFERSMLTSRKSRLLFIVLLFWSVGVNLWGVLSFKNAWFIW